MLINKDNPFRLEQCQLSIIAKKHLPRQTEIKHYIVFLFKKDQVKQKFSVSYVTSFQLQYTTVS